MKASFLAILGLFSINNVSAAPGFYTGKYSNNHLTMMVSGDMYEVVDTLKIYQKDQNNYTFKIVTNSTNGHMCEMDGIANLVTDPATNENYLDYLETSDDLVICNLKIFEKNNDLVVVDAPGGDGIASCRNFYCGARGFLETSFTLNSRVDTTTRKSNVSLQPAKGTKLCFDRSYSSSHMKTNRRQAFEHLTFVLSSDENSNQLRWNSYAVTRLPSELEFASSGICKANSSGDLNCDSFTLSAVNEGTNAGSVKFTVNKNSSVKFTAENKTVSLRGTDKDNNVFRLYPLSNCGQQ